MSAQNQTATWLPNLTGLDLPRPLTNGINQAYLLIYSLRDELARLKSTITNQGGGGARTPGVGITTVNNVRDERSVLNVYQNTTGKVMWVSASVAANVATLFTGVADSANPPMTILAEQYAGFPNNAVVVPFWVMPGDYYRVVYSGSGVTPTVHEWIEYS